jgi:signal transduction histidine kinase
MTTLDSEVKLCVKVFKRAIENLIKNAIQALGDGGVIEVKVGSSDGQLFISVNDNGPGLPYEIKKNLFEPFVYHRKDGTGLGLFMVYHAITDIHHGEIWFDSEQDKGTTFYISIPIT